MHCGKVTIYSLEAIYLGNGIPFLVTWCTTEFISWLIWIMIVSIVKLTCVILFMVNYPSCFKGHLLILSFLMALVNLYVIQKALIQNFSQFGNMNCKYSILCCIYFRSQNTLGSLVTINIHKTTFNSPSVAPQKQGWKFILIFKHYIALPESHAKSTV